MESIISTSDNIAVLQISGSFDVLESEVIDSWLKTNLLSNDPQLVIDLAEVDLIDTAGIATLVQALKRYRQKGGNLHLCNLQPAVWEIFELTHLDRAFDIFPSQEEAVQAFLGLPGGP